MGEQSAKPQGKAFVKITLNRGQLVHFAQQAMLNPKLSRCHPLVVAVRRQRRRIHSAANPP
jgi:hypothetical protein